MAKPRSSPSSPASPSPQPSRERQSPAADRANVPPQGQPADERPDQRFRREYHLRRSADFGRVFDRRCSAADGRLVVYACRNEVGVPRIGLSVSRKIGGAVVRNRCRRLLREAFRLERVNLPPGVDLVLIPRAGWSDGLAALRRSLVALARRAARKLA